MKLHFGTNLLKIVILVLALLLICSSVVNVYQLQKNSYLASQNKFLEECNVDAGVTDFQLLSPDIAWLSVDAFLEKRTHLITNYAELKQNLYILLGNAQGDYSLYFEDLTTGAWIGMNEKEEFVPLSLLKVPTLVATLKEVELGTVSLEQTVKLRSEDLDNKSGDLWRKGAGYEITVKDLLIDLIKHSDNTAVLTLNRQVISDKVFIESRLAMGLDAPDMSDARLTPKAYANILRGLYFSNYLRRPFSELGLTIMLETDFNSQIPAGVPSNIRVAHKVGIYASEGYYHDCGIVYAEHTHYILCIMSKNTSAKEADRVISEASKMVYTFVSSKNNSTQTSSK